MPVKRRRFKRLTGKRRYRKLFVVAVEGVKTEPHYFNIIDTLQLDVRVLCLTANNKSSPAYVLKKLKDYLNEKEFKFSDEAWIVVDKNSWHDDQLMQLHNWAQEKNNYGFALSNPNFEYWLLLHFEDGTKIISTKNCTDRLKRHIPNYDKQINANKITKENVHSAIRRAILRDNPPCTDWPQNLGCTTVYKLVQNIFHNNS